MPARTAKQQQAKRRATVIAYTGLPPGMLARLTPDDVNLKAGTLRVSPRRKGRGVEARTLPVTAPALLALRAFDKAGDYGPFRQDMLSRAFKRAARATGEPSVRLYDMRHSFATALYRETKDLATVARFLQHSTTALTARYAMGATQDVDTAAARALGRSLSSKPVPKRRSPMKKRKR
jgi:integrase